ncbi:MAG: hypothetical protein V7677_16405 [Motiliproteus sp.]
MAFPIGFSIIIMTLSIPYGFQYLFSAEIKMGWFAVFTGIFTLALFALAYLTFSSPTAITTPTEKEVDIAGPLMCVGSLSLTVFFNTTSLVAVISIMAIALLATGLWFRWGGLIASRGVFVIAVGLGVYLLGQTPLDPGAADMLPIVQAAGAHFLQGESPYGVVFPQASVFPFVYLPGTWLPYLPLVALDLDLRVLNLVGLIGFAVIAEMLVRNASVRANALSVALYPLLCSPILAQALVYGQVWPYWIMAALLGVFLLQQRLLLAAFILGLMLATRQWAVFFAWPLAVYFAGRLPLSEFVRLFIVILLGFALLIAPIFIFDPTLFQVAFVDVAKSAPQAFLSEKVTSQVGLVALMSAAGIQSAPLVLMSLVAVVVAVLVYRCRHASPEWLIFFVGLAYIFFVTCNFQVFRYYYIPGLWFIAMSYALASERGSIKGVFDFHERERSSLTEGVVSPTPTSVSSKST